MKFLLIQLTLLAVLMLPVLADAQTAPRQYTVLAPLPGTTNCGDNVSNPSANCTTTSEVYLKGLYNLAIGGSFALAFVMIVFGGIKYISTDAVFGKQEGKKMIYDAVWGLIIILTAYLLLQTIDPRLVNSKLFGGSSSGNTPSGTAVPTPSGSNNFVPGPEATGGGRGNEASVPIRDF